MRATVEGRAVDTVIVGGGIAGVALAYYLAEAGANDITLVEGGELGCGATGSSFAGVRQQFSTELEIELSKRGLAFWKSVEDRFDAPCPFNQTGYLFVTADQARLAKLAAAAELQRALGAGPVKVLQPGEVRDVAPWLRVDDLAGGCWTPEDGRVNAPDGVAALTKAARGLGVRIRQHWPVTRIERRPGGFNLIGPSNEVMPAEQVVVAAGISAPGLLRPLGFDVDVSPMVLHHALTEPTLEGLVVPLTVDFDSGFCVEREGAGLAVSILLQTLPPGYGQQDMLTDWYEAATTRAPGLLDVGITHLLTSIADNVSDGHPNAGPVDDGLWVLAGFAGHGVMHGPPVAELLARQMLDRPDARVDLSVMDPLRSRATDKNEEWMVAAKKA